MDGEADNDFAAIFMSRDEQLRQLSRLMELASKNNSQEELSSSSSPGIHVNETETLRSLFLSELETLQGVCRCRSQDWSKIRLLLPADDANVDQSSHLALLVSDTNFQGIIVLDMTNNASPSSSQSSWHKLTPGIHSNLMVSDSIFKLFSCRVYRNSLLSDTFVGHDAVVLNCGHISAAKASYGRLNVEVGPESGGGRNLDLTSESTMVHVCHQLRGGKVFEKSGAVEVFDLNVFSQGCVVRDTPTVRSTYLHENSRIEASASVSNATLFPDASITNSSSASNVLLQWNASIVDHSAVSDTLLMEQSQSGPNSIVAATVLGPDVHVSAGEVHASVIGPNTNAHHQSLVIGVLWPMGRGNVGYGANVGSNHTGRIPDQETSSGEGTFWGLSCVIKFPVDLTYAPYSIVAAGTTLAPQRVCMPFSLIVGQPGSDNEIIPGWVLQSSPYTLARSEKKFATRRKAKRHDFYTGWKIFRPEIIDMCRWARKELEAGGAADATVNGLGGNKLTDRARSVGIKAYRDCLQRYALQGLFEWIVRTAESGSKRVDVNAIHYELLGKEAASLPLQNPADKVEWPSFPWDHDLNEWEYQRSLLLEEFPVDTNVAAWLENLMQTLVALEKDFSRRVHKCKSRDDSRGAATIPGYAEAHVLADKDPVIIEARKRAEAVEATVAKLLGKLSSTARARL